MDFYQFRTRETKQGDIELYPGFTVGRSTDLMVRGGNFYAIWDEEAGLWSTDEYDVARLIDKELRTYADTESQKDGRRWVIKDMRSFESNSWSIFQKFLAQVQDNSHQLDQNLVFSNTEVCKTSYASRRLPYSLAPGDYSAWDEVVGTLYSVEERAKIEWAIGAIVSGDSKFIQKFMVFYGPPGSGKGTVLNVVEKLFDGYTTTFDAKALGSSTNQFATEVFKHDPLVGIQQDGDLSRIEDNARLNSIVSHEGMTMNEKFKSAYTSRVNAFLLLGTNKPVKISDSKSGIIRRLIDVHPTGSKIPINHYHTLVSRMDFELGAIAYHCLDIYRGMGRNHFEGYRPMEMMLQTDVFFNFIESYFDVFKAQDGTSLAQAYLLYKEYCGDSNIEHVLPKYKFREELRNYFNEFRDRAEIGGHTVRSYYEGFNANKFKAPAKDAPAFSLVIEDTESLLDEAYSDQPAQLATSHEVPGKKWANVTTTLKEIDTSELHFVKVPESHIVIDFDLKGDDGEKSLELNLEAASNWPPTYAELSKGGAGVHLHYIYDGDVETLRSEHSKGIEVKTLTGDSSLRRRLSKCNSVPIAHINSGLPLKEKKMLDAKTIQTEKGLRDLIRRTMNKEFHSGTKPSVDFIKKILDDAYEGGLSYDLSDLKGRVIGFAQGSSNQALQAIKTVQQMHFQSENQPDPKADEATAQSGQQVFSDDSAEDKRLVLFDVEVYPNLFIVCWKYEGDSNVVRMINPKAQEIEQLLALRLVGFNNRRYDNHILYAAFMGYTNEQLYKLSQKLIANDRLSAFGEAYSLSYCDLWDISTVKKSLKWFMIQLGMRHMEMDLPWDQPVPEDLWPKVVEYCVNDVLGTEGVLKDRRGDFMARQILSDISGLSMNDTTPKQTAKIIFGNDRNPQSQFVYTPLAREFPGYTFDPHKTTGKSEYRGEDPGEGGYVYAEPGYYENVAVLDIASMHPTTIEQLNLFGDYTPNFAALKSARIAIKRGDYDSARRMFDGKLEPYLHDEGDAKALSYALKIAINIVYGLTSAKFDNPFRDMRNLDNIVAKRGALFMIDLKHAVQEKGFQVVHIKTDSIKIPNATTEIIDFVSQFGARYGYEFEHEATYDKFCLVNDAVYIARQGDKWDATGAQFQHPVVYKTLFSHEEIHFEDYCETKQVVKGAMYLDFEHDTPMATAKEGLRFVGRTGLFVPVKEGQNGAMLYRVVDDKHYAVTGTKGHLWLEAEMAEERGSEIDQSYYQKLINDAITTIGQFVDFDQFAS